MAHKANNNIGSVTQDELKNIRRSKAGRHLLNAAANIAEQRQFGEGDVLVVGRITKVEGYPQYETMSSTNLPQKYLVVYKDEAGLLYCKRILQGGKLGKGVVMPATWDSSYWRFEMDPEMADSIILSQEDKYDPMAQARMIRKLKEEVKRYNKSIETSLPNAVTASQFLESLQIGQKVWTLSYYTDPRHDEFVVQDIKKVPLDLTIRPYSKERVDEEYVKANLTYKVVVKVKSSTRQWENEWRPVDIARWRHYFLQEPKVVSLK